MSTRLVWAGIAACCLAADLLHDGCSNAVQFLAQQLLEQLATVRVG